MEIEAKYAITGALGPQSLDSLDLAPYTLRPGEDLQHHDILLDTPERAITGSRHALRVRDANGHKILTLKGPGTVSGSIHQREELEAPLPEGESEEELFDYTTWPEKIAAPVAQMAGLHPLAPLVEVRVRRQTWVVERGGREIGELALDEGSIEANGASQPVRELELELKGAGTEQDLRALDERLRERLPLEPEKRSKLERGLALLSAMSAASGELAGHSDRVANGLAANGLREEWANGSMAQRMSSGGAPGQSAEAVLGETDDLPKRWVRRPTDRQSDRVADGAPDQSAEHRAMTGYTPLQSAARHAVKRYLIRLRKHEPGVRHGEDPEDVHDMRVATRRIRSALAILEEAPGFDHKRLRKMRAHLRALSHELGAVRDLDVFLRRLGKYEDEHRDQSAGLRPLREELERRRDHARATLRHELASGKLERRLQKLEAFATQPVDVAGEARPELVRTFAGGAIWRRYEEALSYECELPGAPPPELHQLRIACKRLRYAIEMFEPALGEEAKPVLKALVAAQDHLGSLQDTVVALATVDELRGQPEDDERADGHGHGHRRGHGPQAGARGREMTHEERAALGAYADALALRRDELKSGFAPVWAEISDEPFRSALALLIAQL